LSDSLGPIPPYAPQKDKPISQQPLASEQTIGAVLLVIPLVLFKIFCFVLVLAVIESSLSKLRLFRIAEFLGAAFITSVAAMIARLFAF
jgi:formate hydrogenlyase subunit 4